MGFRGREGLLFAIDRTTGGCEHELAYLRPRTSLQEVQGTQDIDLGIVGRVIDGVPDIHLGGMVIDHVEPGSAKQF